MANFADPKMLLGFLAVVAVALLASDWSVQRAIAFAVVWGVAAIVVLVRHRKAGRRDLAEPAGAAEPADSADDTPGR
ncbi:hypothetical protein IU433_23945 [Nocardia puris]|uniref:Uncharacterized protein n=1 Tax=Nocardia puris TaxID=208602 RepID=A0A366DH03_9NOCA|nr:hypothetical protein [Nocardia puris]MBF6213189.1 hypothetical protein [Nocardia puris]MBF6370140.1 hypothetical protein [Nocardia puris]MBF6462068.1 hypothetical protein [Nocardia puris]RBO89370.1 hypothetical protein DFR74_10747 [Nocardia puris]